MRLRAGAERVFDDTNVLVYVFDPTRWPSRPARNLVIDSLGSCALALSTRVLLEFYWTVTRKPGVALPRPVAAGFARQLMAAHVVTSSADLVGAVERSAAPRAL